MKSAVLWGVAFALLCVSTPVGAATPDASDGPIAVVALEDSAGTREAVDRMGSMLASSGRRVEYGDQLEATLARRRVPDPSAATMRSFAGLSDTIADGIKAYFYQSKERALETLSPVVELGLSETAALVERPDLVDQVYEAGIVVVRALLDLDQRRRAEDLAATLVAQFPAKSPELRTAPPHIIELFRDKREALANENSRLIVTTATDQTGCTPLLNGAPVESGNHVVAANRPYYLRLDCGLRRSPMWRVSLTPGEVESIDLIAEDPLAVDLADDSFASRRRAEGYLRALASLGDFTEVVGIRRPEDKSGPTLFAHFRDGSFTWTEASDLSSVVRYTEDTFGVSESPPSNPAEATARSTTTPRRTRWMGWPLVGLGAASATAGAFFVRASLYNQRLLNCYDNITAPAGTSCEGAGSAGLEISRDAQQAEVRKIRQQAIAGALLLGVGTGALVFGVVRLASRPRPVALVIDPFGGGVAVRGSF